MIWIGKTLLVKTDVKNKHAYVKDCRYKTEAKNKNGKLI